MAIPKIVHLCWFGGAKSDSNVLRCKASHQILIDRGYEIRVWNEENYDMGRSLPLRNAYSNKKWSLVSNYVRVDVLRRFGGVYLDMDVEVVTDFDHLLDSDFFIGFMWDCALGTAVIGSCPSNMILCEILGRYDSVPESLISPNNNTFTDFFLNRIEGFQLTGIKQTIGGTVILDKFAFEHPSLFRRRNYTIHHFSQSWINKNPIKGKVKIFAIYVLSLWLYRKYVCFHSKLISPYYGTYLRHMRRRHVSALTHSVGSS